MRTALPGWSVSSHLFNVPRNTPMLRRPLPLAILFFCATQCTFAQYDADHPEDSVYASPGRIGLGLRFGAVRFIGDVKDRSDFEGTSTPFHLGADVLLHYRLWQAVQGTNAMRIGLEAAAGFRALGASHRTYEFRTDVYPVSGSATIEFYSMAALRPFVSVGIGALPYRMKEVRNILTGERAKDATGTSSGVAFWVPLRIGLRYTISPRIDVLGTIERSVTLTDRLDGIASSSLDWMNDNFDFFSVGVAWYFLSSNNTDPYGDNIYTQPVVVAVDPARDSDSDGLRDLEEITEYKTDPYNADSDGDGLRDGEEIVTHKTRPLLADTDGDGVPDGREIMLKLQPLARDSDGDGISDGTDDCPDQPETVNGYKDADGCPDEVERGELLFQRLGDIMILENVEFESGKAVLLKESLPTLDKVAKNLLDNPKVNIEIRGHTDSTGDFEKNILLSAQRAESVKAYIVSRGVDERRIETQGFGPSQPVAPNSTVEGRQRNRRIEFRITRFDD
ncbi:MAG: OmpA family protein [Ignavibacteriae bacterium]|nr:OmpA family protein [Ignavibacteriota bacterium]